VRDHSARGLETSYARPWPGWCCSYCSGPLDVRSHGLFCSAEGRWFATDRGVHRLLPEERRREMLPFLELYQRVRRDEGWRGEPGLPAVAPGHPHAKAWAARAQRFRAGLQAAEETLGPPPWRVLDAGAGCCWASARLLERGHQVAAVDLNLDVDDGLVAAERFIPDPAALPRAEADLEALPVEPGDCDLVLVADALHYMPRLARTLVELRRVTRRGGVLLVLDSPVYRRRQDGEAVVADRMRAQARRYSLTIPRESVEGYLVLGELPDVFRSSGWNLEIRSWPPRPSEWAWDAIALVRGRRRPARYPILIARRDG